MGSDTAKGGRFDSLHPERIVLATPQRLTLHSLLLLLLLFLLHHPSVSNSLPYSPLCLLVSSVLSLHSLPSFLLLLSFFSLPSLWFLSPSRELPLHALPLLTHSLIYTPHPLFLPLSLPSCLPPLPLSHFLFLHSFPIFSLPPSFPFSSPPSLTPFIIVPPSLSLRSNNNLLWVYEASICMCQSLSLPFTKFMTYY